MFDVKVDGVAELREKMKGLPYKVQKQVVQPAVRYGANIIAEQARAIVRHMDDPTTGRQIARNIVVKYRSKRSAQIKGVVYSIGVEYPRGRMPKGNPDDGVNTSHWHLLELGTEKMRAQPFLVPAAVMRAQDVSQEIAARAAKRLEKLEL
ncbi:MAG: HK97 gp10 family phage protein [Comamonas sp.]|uniref:HK97-gp10 family putative phage morphogenesis protein n=1 Tax=Comamonas sp. TaxID=34028 RepID=UPI002FC691B3